MRYFRLRVLEVFRFVAQIDLEDFSFTKDLITKESYLIWIFLIERKDESVGGRNRLGIADLVSHSSRRTRVYGADACPLACQSRLAK